MVAQAITSVRARLLALLLFSSVPITALSASIIWQSYNAFGQQATVDAGLLRQAVLSRDLVILGDEERLLRSMSLNAALADLDNPACTTFLKQIYSVSNDRHGNIYIVDPDGRLRCSARPQPTPRLAVSGDNPTTLAHAVQTGSFTVSPLHVGVVSGRPVLSAEVSLPMLAGQRRRSVLVATLLADWLVESNAIATADARRAAVTKADCGVWLVDTAGSLIPVAGARQEWLPPPDVLAAVIRGGTPVTTTARGKLRFAYAGATLPGGLALLVGISAVADRAAAERLLVRRLAEMGALLSLGLVCVGIGVNVFLVAPVKRVSAAVARWRGGGKFETGELWAAPRELVDLSHSFADATAALTLQEDRLRVSAGQQELLMQEIHHRVKNNLQIVASLLNLQAARIRVPEARAEFQAARDRIRALATLHRHLYAHGELHTINMKGFLKELCDQLLHAIGETPGGGRIELVIDAPEIQISSDQAVPIALIITEAVSNAGKYAFPGGRSGRISVSLAIQRRLPGADEATTEAGTLDREVATLVIEDNGIGIPAGQAETETGVRDGLGLNLIRGFSRQLGATLTVTQEAGTRYVLEIPLHRAAAGAAGGASPA